MTDRTTWRGVTLDTRTAAQCAELAAIIGDDILVTPTQGSYRPHTRYSAGTHSGGGAVDISVAGLTAAQERRLIIAEDKVGLCGWIRPAISGLWVRHNHVLSIPAGFKGPGVLDPSAWDQITACRRGLDGLASAGPDPHKTLRTWTTWETYQQRKDNDMPSPSDLWSHPLDFRASKKAGDTKPAGLQLAEACRQATLATNLARDAAKVARSAKNQAHADAHTTQVSLANVRADIAKVAAALEALAKKVDR